MQKEETGLGGRDSDSHPLLLLFVSHVEPIALIQSHNSESWALAEDSFSYDLLWPLFHVALFIHQAKVVEEIQFYVLKIYWNFCQVRNHLQLLSL